MTQLALFTNLSLVRSGGRHATRSRSSVPYWQRPDWVEKTIAAAERARREREAARLAAFESLGPLTVVLVSCGARKGKERTQARDFYTSALFRKARRFAEKFGDRWYVISGLWGLVHPERELSPYNFKLSQLRQGERDAWADRVVRSVKYHVPPGSRIVIVAGKLYRERLVWRLIRQGFDVETPTSGQNIFELMHYLTEAASPARRTETEAMPKAA